MSRNSLKTAKNLKFFFFPFAAGYKRGKAQKSVKRRQKWLARNCQMPNGERISRYIKKKSCYQVQAHTNFKCTYLWEYYF